MIESQLPIYFISSSSQLHSSITSTITDSIYLINLSQTYKNISLLSSVSNIHPFFDTTIISNLKFLTFLTQRGIGLSSSVPKQSLIYLNQFANTPILLNTSLLSETFLSQLKTISNKQNLLISVSNERNVNKLVKSMLPSQCAITIDITQMLRYNVIVSALYRKFISTNVTGIVLTTSALIPTNSLFWHKKIVSLARRVLDMFTQEFGMSIQHIFFAIPNFAVFSSPNALLQLNELLEHELIKPFTGLKIGADVSDFLLSGLCDTHVWSILSPIMAVHKAPEIESSHLSDSLKKDEIKNCLYINSSVYDAFTHFSTLVRPDDDTLPNLYQAATSNVNTSGNLAVSLVVPSSLNRVKKDCKSSFENIHYDVYGHTGFDDTDKIFTKLSLSSDITDKDWLHIHCSTIRHDGQLLTGEEESDNTMFFVDDLSELSKPRLRYDSAIPTLFYAHELDKNKILSVMQPHFIVQSYHIPNSDYMEEDELCQFGCVKNVSFDCDIDPVLTPFSMQNMNCKKNLEVIQNKQNVDYYQHYDTLYDGTFDTHDDVGEYEYQLEVLLEYLFSTLDGVNRTSNTVAMVTANDTDASNHSVPSLIRMEDEICIMKHL